MLAQGEILIIQTGQWNLLLANVGIIRIYRDDVSFSGSASAWLINAKCAAQKTVYLIARFIKRRCLFSQARHTGRLIVRQALQDIEVFRQSARGGGRIGKQHLIGSVVCRIPRGSSAGSQCAATVSGFIVRACLQG